MFFDITKQKLLCFLFKTQQRQPGIEKKDKCFKAAIQPGKTVRLLIPFVFLTVYTLNIASMSPRKFSKSENDNKESSYIYVEPSLIKKCGMNTLLSMLYTSDERSDLCGKCDNLKKDCENFMSYQLFCAKVCGDSTKRKKHLERLLMSYGPLCVDMPDISLGRFSKEKYRYVKNYCWKHRFICNAYNDVNYGDFVVDMRKVAREFGLIPIEKKHYTIREDRLIIFNTFFEDHELNELDDSINLYYYSEYKCINDTIQVYPSAKGEEMNYYLIKKDDEGFHIHIPYKTYLIVIVIRTKMYYIQIR